MQSVRPIKVNSVPSLPDMFLLARKFSYYEGGIFDVILNEDE